MEGVEVVHPKAGAKVRLLAFLERVAGRHPRPTPGENLARRAAQMLADLEDDRSDLRRQVAIEHLGRERDLLSSEATLTPVVLALRVRAHALAKTEPVLATHLEEAKREPVVKLFNAIVSQAGFDRATAIRIGFSAEGPSLLVHYRQTVGWKEAVTLPMNLNLPLKGAALFEEAARAHPFLVGASFMWEQDGDLVIEFGPQGAEVIAV